MVGQVRDQRLVEGAVELGQRMRFPEVVATRRHACDRLKGEGFGVDGDGGAGFDHLLRHFHVQDDLLVGRLKPPFEPARPVVNSGARRP